MSNETSDERLPSGESAVSERSNYIGTGHGKLLSLNPEGYEGFEEWEENTYPPPMPIHQQRTKEQRILRARIEKLMQYMPKKQAELLLQRFWEGRTLAQLGKERGVTPQAMAGQVQTALDKFTQVMGEHGEEVIWVDEADQR